MTSARAASFAALTLAALATSGCGIGTSYAVSADYANAMNDSDWHFRRVPKAAPEPKLTTTEPATMEPASETPGTDKPAAESSVPPAATR